MDLFPVVTIALGSLSVPAYPVALILGVLVASAIFLASADRFSLKPPQARRLLLLGIVSGLLFARLVYSLVRYEYLFFDAMDGRFLGLGPFFDLREGGLSLFGMLFGVWFAAVVDARFARGKAAPRLDALALPLAVLIAITRFVEILAGQGYGGALETAWLRFFPLSIQDAYGDWLTAVFALEGQVALAIAVYLVYSQRTTKRPEDSLYLRLMVPLCAAQIFLESLRRDDYLRLEGNGFVRVSQVLALVFLVVVTAWLTWRLVKTGRPWQRSITSWLALLVAAGTALAAEFYEKLPLSIPLLYTVSALAQGVLMAVLLRFVQHVLQETANT
ncbi:MAG: hypothetical protein GX810_03945 [Clostridiales bacterium]|nr:hypothetical protein [Clostridiales bacterium]